MSQSQVARRDPFGKRNDGPRSLTDEESIETVLEALDDANCRTILAATSDDALTVTEICEEFGIAQSTGYRKVEALVEAGLLEEKVRLRPGGSHVSTYACTVEDVTVSVGDENGITLSVSHGQAGETGSGAPHRNWR